jgi:D-sedoheptulose 7-phosphate isomerase
MTVMIQLEPDRAHLAALVGALVALDDDLATIERWGRRLASVLLGGGRLLAAGNGGSAAQAQHLTAELVGRYGDDRVPLSALALHAETSSLTAITNDYGPAEAFARQVRAHGRPGDVLLALSTSGESENLVVAAKAGAAGGLVTWALAGRGPSTLTRAVEESICVNGRTAATIQEVHLVVLHLLCEAVEREVTGVRVMRVEEVIG